VKHVYVLTNCRHDGGVDISVFKSANSKDEIEEAPEIFTEEVGMEHDPKVDTLIVEDLGPLVHMHEITV
jgi:hypothetical protein